MNRGYKDREGVEWVDAMGGLYFGRAPDGVVRIAITNGLPPWDPKAEPRQGNMLQPEHFAKLAEFATRGAPEAPAIAEVLTHPSAPMDEDAVVLALSVVVAYFNRAAHATPPAGLPWPRADVRRALPIAAAMLGELKWARDVIARASGYVGPLAQGPCPLEDLLLVAKNQMRGVDRLPAPA